MDFVNSNVSLTKPKILIYLFGSLGDTVVAIPALRAVRRKFPNAELILLQNLASANLVTASQIIPEDLVDGYLSYDSQIGESGRFSRFYNLWGKLRQAKFQAAIYLVISERPPLSVKRDKLFFRFAGIKHLFGFHSFSKEKLYPFDAEGQPKMTEGEAVRKLIRLEKDGIESSTEDFRLPLIPFSKIELEKIKEWLDSRRKKAGARLISIAPGCKTPANNWSSENFLDIGHRLIAEENCELLVIGGKAEQDTGRRMVSEWGAGINAAGEFSARESGMLLSLCDFHFGLDTGTTHLAAAVGTPCFALFHGRDNPGHWFPMGRGHTILYHPVKCAGCRSPVCPVQNHPCMQNISVESVWLKLRSFINDRENSETPTTRFAV